MSNRLHTRSVKVELLRAGPAHNQLLSPLTPYLGICEGGEAGVITVPFEHMAFLRRVKAMRETGADAKDRLPELRDIGVEIAKILGAVPRLAGALNGDTAGPDTLVHLRLVLSAAELALLPFELSKVPVSATQWDEAWLSLQARTPVVITRRTREVSSAKVNWAVQPRVLFVASDPQDDGIPFEAHRAALIDALRPYLRAPQPKPRVSHDGRREQYEGWLTILRNATFEDVLHECAQTPYTHVHILAHGGQDRTSEEPAYGLVLRTRAGEEDVISAERLAGAFTTMIGGALRRPNVVTLATCDSGNRGSVIAPGASLAHALHQAGIALVVASQFPLSMEGSDLLVKDFYPGVLRGDHPLILLHRIRTDLHGRLGARAHDWASLVVYEAFPDALEAQLEELRYYQGREQVYVSFEQLDRAMLASQDDLPPDRHEALAARVFRTTRNLPDDGPFRLECLGLRAGSFKRLAQAEFYAAHAIGERLGRPGKARKDAKDGDRNQLQAHLQNCLLHLDDALRNYEDAAKGFLRNEAADVRPPASLHWAMGQQLSIAAVLGQPVPDGMWETALLAAQAHIEATDPKAQAWAYGSLIELWLLRRADPKLAGGAGAASKTNLRLRREAEKQALHCANELIKRARSDEYPPLLATRAQVDRYADWWSDPWFEAVVHDRFGTHGGPVRAWGKQGVAKLAEEVLRILDLRGPGWRAVDDADDNDNAACSDAGDAAVASEPAAEPESDAASLASDGTANADEAKGGPADKPAVAAPTFLSAKSGARATRADDRATLRIEMLPAGHGDCLWIEYGDGPKTQRVLVDCGSGHTYKKGLRPRIEAQDKAQRTFELFIMSHIDEDHIGGGLALFKEAKTLGVDFGDVWFNGWRHLKQYGNLNARQGEIFSELADQGGYRWNGWRDNKAIVLPEDGSLLPPYKLPGGLVLTLLSPTVDKLRALAPKWEKEIKALGKKPGEGGFLAGRARGPGSTDVAALADAKFDSDTAENNGSSIAVLAEYEGKSVLLGADAHAPVMVNALRRLLAARKKDKLAVDAFKLPHHGSRNNLNNDLMALLDCRKYLVSTNGSTFYHPDGEAIARVIRHGGERPQVLFNYDSAYSAVWKPAELQKKYNYEAVYPVEAGKLLVNL